MKVDLITTSVKGWNRYIKPLIDSVEKHEGITSNIIVVDAGSHYPDEYKDVKIIHTPMLNCCEAQNVGMRNSDADWFLITDCDVICEGKFIDKIKGLPQNSIYGNQMTQAKHKFFTGPSKWLDGWIYAIPRNIYDKIGNFDENFIGSGFEDADYCWRAVHVGFDVKLAMFPFKHLAAGQKRAITENYKKVRLKNIEYLKMKWGLE